MAGTRWRLTRRWKQGRPPPRGSDLGAAIWQIVVADVSMSLDNVLAVAGAAKDHPNVIIGLLLSVVLMGAAANMIAHLLHKHRWIGWVGLANHHLCGSRHDLARQPGSAAAHLMAFVRGSKNDQENTGTRCWKSFRPARSGDSLPDRRSVSRPR